MLTKRLMCLYKALSQSFEDATAEEASLHLHTKLRRRCLIKEDVAAPRNMRGVGFLPKDRRRFGKAKRVPAASRREGPRSYGPISLLMATQTNRGIFSAEV